MKIGDIQWPRDAQRAALLAIQQFQLHRGWQAFNKDDWVAYVNTRYPALTQIALACSITRPVELQAQVQFVLLNALCTPVDAPLIVAYFAGKLGLEELSCCANGAAARACDKRTAFTIILDALLANLF